MSNYSRCEERRVEEYLYLITVSGRGYNTEDLIGGQYYVDNKRQPSRTVPELRLNIIQYSRMSLQVDGPLFRIGVVNF